MLHRLMANLPGLNRWGSRLAPLVNLAQRNRLTRWMMHHLAGIDLRRSLPPMYFNHFRRWFARHGGTGAGARGKVILLDDCFTTFNEPAIGKSAVHVLHAAGYDLELAGLCCGRTLLSKGYLEEARTLIQQQAPRLASRIAAGAPILGLEPSCLLTLVDEWPELLPGPATSQIAKSAHLADAWLAEQVRAAKSELNFKSQYSVLNTPRQALVHGHCHQKALVGTAGTVNLLKLIPGLDVRVLDTGCCGMAGSFGFETEHYDLSVKIAEQDLLPKLAAEPEALVVAPGTSCRHQIHDLAKRRALHPLEVLAQAMSEPEA
jgi:Fe-S oxidoreductase